MLGAIICKILLFLFIIGIIVYIEKYGKDNTN